MYNRIIDLKIATPQIIINYGLFLEEQKYFEEGFKVSYIILVVLLLMVGLSFYLANLDKEMHIEAILYFYSYSTGYMYLMRYPIYFKVWI